MRPVRLFTLAKPNGFSSPGGMYYPKVGDMIDFGRAQMLIVKHLRDQSIYGREWCVLVVDNRHGKKLSWLENMTQALLRWAICSNEWRK